MIAYSAEAEVGRAYLLRSYNDIEIYVEDATCQNMYVRLINRILHPNGKRISHVFPLRGKKNVVDRCAADQARASRRLYLIDGDHELITDTPPPPLNHLYRLQVYCAENLLLSEHSIVTIACECSVDERWQDLAVRLALRPLLEHAVEILLPLFVVYAIVQHLGLGLTTAEYPVQRLLVNQNDPNSLSRKLVRERILGLTREIRGSVGRARYKAVRDLVLRSISRGGGDRSAYISGKRYLLPLVHAHLRGTVQFRDSFDQLKVRLAQHCELEIDAGLAAAVRAAVN